MVGLCRLCASLRKMDVLFTIKEDSSDICEKIRKCCALNIKMYDPLPKSVCQECIENLNNSHKFYTKVKDAQETLQALFPPLSNQKDNGQEKEGTQPPLVQSVSVINQNPKQKTNVVVQDKEKLTKIVEGITKNPLKQIKLGNFLIRQNKDFVKELHIDKKNVAESLQLKDVMQRVYNILELDKEESICKSSYELIEAVEENIEELSQNESENYLYDQEFSSQQEQLIEEYHVLDVNETQNPIAVLNEDCLVSDDVPKNEVSVQVEYMECYDDNGEDNETPANIDIVYPNYKGLSKHLTTLPTHLKLKSWKNYKYLCFICDVMFPTFSGLKSHIEQVHSTTQIDKLQYKCYDCKKIISRYNFFLNHVRSKHHPDLKLKCDVCDLTCQSFKQLSHHRRVNCKEAKNFAHTIPCSQCFKSFHSTFGLENHCKIQHDSSKPKVIYKCTQCHKEFQYKSCLKSHQKFHTDTKKFSCTYCEKSFYNKLSLEQHLYVHVNEKLYQCNTCYKRYKTFQTLDEHQKLHTNEKRFKCQFCEKCFTQKVQKLAHERSHTGEMPYLCKQCDKRYRYRSALNAHIKIHTGDKPYSCEYCVKTFADSSNRNKHVRRMHATSETRENT